jgi:hypothetical protein
MNMNLRISFLLVGILSLFSMLACTPGAVGPTVEPTPDFKAIADATYAAGTAVAAEGMGIDLASFPDGSELDEVIAAPIKATFSHETQSTEYTMESVLGGVVHSWSTPPCGDARLSTDGMTMTWTHAHPPCDATTNHSDVTISALLLFYIGSGSRYAHCDYQGAETGTGKRCVWGDLPR